MYLSLIGSVRPFYTQQSIFKVRTVLKVVKKDKLVYKNCLEFYNSSLKDVCILRAARLHNDYFCLNHPYRVNLSVFI